jgi:hypothetical protein
MRISDECPIRFTYGFAQAKVQKYETHEETNKLDCDA